MKMDGISLLDPEADEIARGLTPVMAQLGPVDLATLDALITAGIAASRALGSGPYPRAVGLRDAQRAGAEYGDDPWVEPGDLLARVFIEEAVEDPPLRAWNRDHETMISPRPMSGSGPWTWRCWTR
jgi:hypothetical protein